MTEMTELRLERGSVTSVNSVMCMETFEERAAIMEFDGGLTRREAEDAAARAQGCCNVIDFMERLRMATGREEEPTMIDGDGNNGPRTDRDENGRFQRGNSGRPKGARHKATVAALALLDGEAEALTRKAIELALEGDVTALRLTLERIASPRRDAPVTFSLPE